MSEKHVRPSQEPVVVKTADFLQIGRDTDKAVKAGSLDLSGGGTKGNDYSAPTHNLRLDPMYELLQIETFDATVKNWPHLTSGAAKLQVGSANTTLVANSGPSGSNQALTPVPFAYIRDFEIRDIRTFAGGNGEQWLDAFTSIEFQNRFMKTAFQANKTEDGVSGYEDLLVSGSGTYNLVTVGIHAVTGSQPTFEALESASMAMSASMKEAKNSGELAVFCSHDFYDAELRRRGLNDYAAEQIHANGAGPGGLKYSQMTLRPSQNTSGNWLIIARPTDLGVAVIGDIDSYPDFAGRTGRGGTKQVTIWADAAFGFKNPTYVMGVDITTIASVL